MTKALLHYSELQPKPLVCVRSKGKKNTFDGAGWKIHDIWASNWTYTGQQFSSSHLRDPEPLYKSFSVFQSNICDVWWWDVKEAHVNTVKHVITNLPGAKETATYSTSTLPRLYTPTVGCSPYNTKWRMCYADVHKQCTSIYMWVYLLT